MNRAGWAACAAAALLSACAHTHPVPSALPAPKPPISASAPASQTVVLSSTWTSVSDLLRGVEAAYRQGRYEEGLALVKRTLELGRSDLSVVDRLGSIYHLLGRDGEAIAVWEQGLRLEKDPRRRRALSRSIALARRSIGLPDSPAPAAARVSAAGKRARRISPRAVARIYDRGVAHYARGEYLQATADFMRVLELDPAHALARRALARLRLDSPNGNPD